MFALVSILLIIFCLSVCSSVLWLNNQSVIFTYISLQCVFAKGQRQHEILTRNVQVMSQPRVHSLGETKKMKKLVTEIELEISD